MAYKLSSLILPNLIFNKMTIKTCPELSPWACQKVWKNGHGFSIAVLIDIDIVVKKMPDLALACPD